MNWRKTSIFLLAITILVKAQSKPPKDDFAFIDELFSKIVDFQLKLDKLMIK